MAETPAQRAARERNLRKGNPRSYSNGDAEEAPATAEEAPRAAESQTFKARPRTAEKPPRKRRTPPRAAEGRAEEAPRASSGGFFGGLLDGLR
jgi:hypothetical protein